MRAMLNAFCAALVLGGLTAIGLAVDDAPATAALSADAPKRAAPHGPQIPDELLARRAIDLAVYNLASQGDAAVAGRLEPFAEPFETASVAPIVAALVVD